MSVASLYVRAFEPIGSPDALPDELTIAELAELRAWSIDGLDHSLMVKLATRMETQLSRRLLKTVNRQEAEWTGAYLVTSDEWTDPRRHPLAYSAKKVTREHRYPMGGAPPGAERQTRPVLKVCVRRDDAADLHLIDRDNWSDGSQAWARIAAPIESLAPVVALDLSRCGERVLTKRAINHLSATYESVKSVFTHPARHEWLELARVGDGKQQWWLGLLEQLFEANAAKKATQVHTPRPHIREVTSEGAVHRAR